MSGIIEGASRLLGRMGLSVSRTSSLKARLPIEATTQERAIVDFVQPYTMTSSERIWNLLRAVRYVQEADIEGAFVECGVWRGGSMMAAALQVADLGVPNRDLWLYDTFAGMTPPSELDVESTSGLSASEILEQTAIGDGNNIWCVADETDVARNMGRTGYPADLVRLIKGDVSATLKQTVPDTISLLRLDTDWYESTAIELQILFPRLAIGGVCILDDYGHWQGARRAVDEYFELNGPRPLIIPVDYSGRIFIKTHA